MRPRNATEQLAGLFFLLIFLLLAAGIVTIGFFYYRGHQEYYRTQVQQHLSAVAKQKASQLERWRQDLLGDAAGLYGNTAFAILARRYFENPDNRGLQDQLRTWLLRVQEAHQYYRVFLLDAKGSERMAFPENPDSASTHASWDTSEIEQSDNVHLVDFRRHSESQPIHLTILVPIIDRQDSDRRIATLVLLIDPEQYLYPFISSWPTQSRTAETLLIRKDGNDALFLNELKLQKNTALNLRIPLENKHCPTVKAALGHEGIVEGPDYRGVQVMAHVHRVPGSLWYLIVRMDAEEIYGPLTERLWLAIVLAGAVLICAGMGVSLVWRQQRARFQQKTHEAAAELNALAERHNAILDAVPDIIMEEDHRNVYTWANRAGTEFFGEDVIGREAAFYFEGEEETSRMAQPLFQGQENVIYGESWQRRRDGQKRLLAWWRRVLKDDKGVVRGALISGRDITEAKYAEQGLIDSLKREQLLGHIIRNASIAVCVGYPDGKLETCNKAFQDLSGYNEEESRRIRWDSVLTSQEWPECEAKALAELHRTKKPVRCEKEYVHRDGRKIPIELVVHSLPDESGGVSRYFAFISDITERKRAEQSIERLNRLLRSICDVNQLIVHEKNPDRLIQEACKLLVDSQGYDSALIIVTDEPGTPRSFAEAGGDDSVSALEEELKQGKLPSCCEHVRSQEGFCTVTDRAGICALCFMSDSCRSSHSMCIRLRHEEKNYGYLIVSVPYGIACGGEEQFLFIQLAGDIAFALRNIELAEQADRSSEALRRSEETYRSLVESISDVIYEMDSEGNISYVSPVVRNVLGYRPEELIGKTFLEFVVPEDRSFVEKELEDLIEGVERPTECRMIAKSGQIRWVRTLTKPVMKGNSFTGARGTLINITESKSTEEALQKRMVALTQPLGDRAGVHFSDLFDIEDIQRIQDAFAEATGVASVITAPDGTPITRISNSCRLCSDVIRQTEKGLANCYRSDSLMGRYNPHGPIVQKCLGSGLWDAGASITVGGKHIANWLVGQVRNEELNEDEMLEYAYEIGADPEEYAKALVEVPVMSKEKFEKVSQALFCFANELSMKAYQNVQQARFIADRQKADALRTRLVTAIEQTGEGVVITDAGGIIQYVNPALEKMTGYDSTELVGETPRILKSGEHDDAFYWRLWNTITRGRAWTGRLVNRKKDGRLYHEDATISPVRDASGKIVNFVAVKRDITEHLELSQQLQQAQKMEAVGTIAGGIAHDFNNLLQVVLGYTELVLNNEDLPQHFKNDLERILTAGKNGADLVHRLLTFSRKTERRPLYLDLNQRVRQTRDLLRRTIPKMIDIDLVLGEDLWGIHADPTQIDQVIMNLAVNARDAMPEGGKLVIQTTNVVVDDDCVRAHLEAKTGRHVLLRISDTGSGMDKETLEHAFEPFYTTKAPGEGTGLGLAMVYGIVKQNDGFIKCDSEVGHGTTFKIYLPAVIFKERLDRADATGMPQGGTETILLVDDEEFIRDLGKRILGQAGYTVLAAINGREALKIYLEKQSVIALVILDLIMPEMGGKECLERLLEINPNVKVLIASGHVANGSSKETLGRGRQGFVAKPFNTRQVLEIVRRTLDKK